MSHCAGELMFRDHRARPPGNQQPSGLYLLLWGPLVHVGCHTALVPPPMCDGAGGPRGQLTSRHHPHCSVCSLKRPGACGKPFSLSLRRVSRSLRAGPSGQGLSRGTLKSALALKMHVWAEAGGAALGLGIALVSEWWSLCPNRSCCPSRRALSPWAGSL